MIYHMNCSIYYRNHCMLEKSVYLFTQWIVISPMYSTIGHWIDNYSVDTSITFGKTYSVDSDAIYTG